MIRKEGYFVYITKVIEENTCFDDEFVEDGSAVIRGFPCSVFYCRKEKITEIYLVSPVETLPLDHLL